MNIQLFFFIFFLTIWTHTSTSLTNKEIREFLGKKDKVVTLQDYFKKKPQALTKKIDGFHTAVTIAILKRNTPILRWIAKNHPTTIISYLIKKECAVNPVGTCLDCINKTSTEHKAIYQNILTEMLFPCIFGSKNKKTHASSYRSIEALFKSYEKFRHKNPLQKEYDKFVSLYNKKGTTKNKTQKKPFPYKSSAFLLR